MRFIQTIFAGAALVAAAFAVEINEFPTSVEAGGEALIKYSPGDETPTTFILRKGESTDLANVTTITESATGGEFTWNVPEDLENGDDYALFVIQGSETNFWGPFTVTGGEEPTSSTSSSASASASATPSSSESITASASTTASLSASSSAAGNSTIASPTLSTATAGGSTTTISGPPQNTGAASQLGSSPLALLFGAAAAMAYLN
ncbi:hypothetical protein CC78DRAFT_132180 [Lojkania enalia]|uniref:Yeast cell wall synthesis Kre9/Knh1-like N-terminal domain-containing protein n=1 Tax=Lojkania enalia TaxID=147567 RepID=A0A9P4NBZ8_9PLEO|nr:hypothetical protein CC78DRAFT_132180 [Didymosphaeria enalia]